MVQMKRSAGKFRCVAAVSATAALILFSSYGTAGAQQAVSRAGAWTTGLTHTVGAGGNRLLVFAFAYENNGVRDVAGVT